MAAIRVVLRWLEYPINLMLWLGLIAGFLMMMHVGVDVFARTLLNHPLSGTTEIVGGWYMVAIAFMPWAWLETRNSHIVAGMFEHLGGPRFNFWLNVFVKLTTLIFIAVFTWQTWVQAILQTSAGEVWEAAGGFIPIWPSRWAVPFAGGLMAVYMALRLVADLGGEWRR
ncbi:MAG TPA: TRAP transporter small permease [Hyphomicrobiaceae bacterium]|nr:TRAP transporter small permease [Hyphomicrobiaceae bacterium]